MLLLVRLMLLVLFVGSVGACGSAAIEDDRAVAVTPKEQAEADGTITVLPKGAAEAAAQAAEAQRLVETASEIEAALVVAEEALTGVDSVRLSIGRVRAFWDTSIVKGYRVQDGRFGSLAIAAAVDKAAAAVIAVRDVATRTEPVPAEAETAIASLETAITELEASYLEHK